MIAQEDYNRAVDVLRGYLKSHLNGEYSHAYCFENNCNLCVKAKLILENESASVKREQAGYGRTNG